MPNKLKRRLSKYSALELIDALYLNNPIELFMGEPEHHYAFIKPEYIGLSEEELDRLVGKKDDRGHRLDVVKSELHPTHPSRGIFNEDGNIFRLTDKGMEDSNYTMFGAVDNDQDPQVVLSYQNGIVLPEWTVTPNGNYINNSYDNIRLNYKAGGGNMLEEDPPTAPKYPDVPTKEAVLAFLKAVDEYRRLKVLAENRLSKNLILPNGEELLRYADETDEQYENRYKTRLSVYNLNVERANKRFESRQLKIDDIVRDVNNNIGLVVEAPKVPFTGEAYKEAAEYERQKEVNKAHDYKNIFDATLTAAELGMSGASLLGAYANWKKWKDLTSLTNPTTAQLAKARIANLLLKALLPMLIGGTGIDAYLTYDALNNDDTPNTIYNGISMGLGALGSVGASDVFLNSRFHSPKIDRILDVLGITLNTGDFLKLGYDTYNSLTKEDNMKATGGALQTPLDWNELSMKEKAAYIRMGVANGYKDIDSIKNVYNEFKEGGNLYGGGSRKLSTTNSLTVLKVINYFMNKGLTDYLAAGLVGNLVRESQLNPNAVNKYSGAFGIALWLGPRKEKLFAKYGSKPTLDLQLDFAWHELNSSHKQGLRSLLASKTAEEAARNAMGYYEFQAGPEGAIREMNKYGLNGQASMDEGIRNAHNIMMNVSPDYRIQNKYPGLNPSIIQYKDLSLPNNSIPQFKYNGLTDYDKSFIVDDETLNKIMNLLSSNTPLGTNVVTPESLKLGVVGPEVVVTEQAPKYYVRPNPQELLDLMNSIMVPYELPEIPKPITATERLALLNKDRNTLLLQDLEDSILRANRLGTPLDEVKLARDVKDLQFYRNMAANGGRLFGLGGDKESLTPSRVFVHSENTDNYNIPGFEKVIKREKVKTDRTLSSKNETYRNVVYYRSKEFPGKLLTYEEAANVAREKGNLQGLEVGIMGHRTHIKENSPGYIPVKAKGTRQKAYLDYTTGEYYLVDNKTKLIIASSSDEKVLENPLLWTNYHTGLNRDPNLARDSFENNRGARITAANRLEEQNQELNSPLHYVTTKDGQVFPVGKLTSSQFNKGIDNAREAAANVIQQANPASLFNHAIMGGTKLLFDPNYTSGLYIEGFNLNHMNLPVGLILGAGDLFEVEDPTLRFASNFINPLSVASTVANSSMEDMQFGMSKGRASLLKVANPTKGVFNRQTKPQYQLYSNGAYPRGNHRFGVNNGGYQGGINVQYSGTHMPVGGSHVENLNWPGLPYYTLGEIDLNPTVFNSGAIPYNREFNTVIYPEPYTVEYEPQGYNPYLEWKIENGLFGNPYGGGVVYDIPQTPTVEVNYSNEDVNRRRSQGRTGNINPIYIKSKLDKTKNTDTSNKHALGGPLVDIINKYADGGLLDWLKQVFGLPIESSGTRVKISKDSNGNYTFNGRKPAEGYTYYDGKTQNVYKFVNGKRTLLKLGESSKNTIRTYDIAKNIAHDDSIAKLTGWEGVPEGEMLNGLNRNKVYRNINPENRISIDNVIADGIRYGLDYHNWAGKRNTGSKGDEALFSRHLGRERNLEEMPITGIRFFGDYNSDGSYRLPNAEYTGIPNYAKRAISRGITEGSIDVDPTGEWTPVEENMYVHPGELTLYKNFSIRENNDSGIYDVFDTYDFPDNWWFPNLNRPEGKQIEVRDTVWGPNAIPELYDPSYTKQNISPISLILNKAFKKK